MKKVLVRLVILALLISEMQLSAALVHAAELPITSVVHIIAQQQKADGSYESVQGGSGVIYDVAGTIWTNAHVVLDAGYQPFDRYLVCIMVVENAAPECIYVANLLAADGDFDLAVLRLSGQDLDGKATKPLLTPIKKMDSSTLRIGHSLSVIGYPSAGGQTVTVTEGSVSGFVYNDKVDPPEVRWIKSDAAINPGNSGGAVVNDDNLFVGIPTFMVRSATTLTYIRPLNFIQDWANYVDEELANQTAPWVEKLVPDRITTLSAIPKNNAVQLNWAPAYTTDGIQYYEVIYDTNPIDFSQYESKKESEMPNYQTTTNTNLTVSNLVNGTKYYFYVEAVSNGQYGSKNWSDPVEATPNATTEIVTQTFSDVNSNHLNSLAITYLKQHNIVAGYLDGTFRPDQTINRAEMVKMIVAGKQVNPDPMVYKNCFPDVREEWYAVYICYAKEKGWIGGYPDGNFRPADLVNRAESLKIIMNAYGLLTAFGTGSSKYADVPTESWFASFVSAAEQLQLLEERGEFNPGRSITRANAAENIYRAALMQEVGIISTSEVWKNPDGSLVSLQEYYPMAVGREWTYQYVMSNANVNVSMTHKIGGTCSTDNSCFSSESSEESSSEFRFVPNRVVQTRLTDLSENSNSNTNYIHPITVISNRDMTIYYKIENPRSGSFFGLDMKEWDGIDQYKLVGFETIDTPDGQKSALRVHGVHKQHALFTVSTATTTNSVEGYITIEGDEYFVKGIGMVKSLKTWSMSAADKSAVLGTTTDTLTSYK